MAVSGGLTPPSAHPDLYEISDPVMDWLGHNMLDGTIFDTGPHSRIARGLPDLGQKSIQRTLRYWSFAAKGELVKWHGSGFFQVVAMGLIPEYERWKRQDGNHFRDRHCTTGE